MSKSQRNTIENLHNQLARERAANAANEAVIAGLRDAAAAPAPVTAPRPAAPPPPPPPPAPPTYAERKAALASKATSRTQLAALDVFDSLDNEAADLIAAQARR